MQQYVDQYIKTGTDKSPAALVLKKERWVFISGTASAIVLKLFSNSLGFGFPTFITHYDSAKADSKGVSAISGPSSFSEPILDQDDPVDHLIFVIHGIGEHFFTTDDLGLNLGTIIDCTSSVRSLADRIFQLMPKEERKKGRLEFLPIQWHDVVHDKERSDAMEAVTQKTVPVVRAIANQLFVDILFYMEPEHRLLMANKVAAEANALYHKYKANNPTFSGKVSIFAHSLGTVITFDLLRHAQPIVDDDDLRDFEDAADDATATSRPPTLRRRLSDNFAFMPLAFDFNVENFFAIGSPVGFFATIRGNELGPQYKFKTCKKYFNIMHPHDPVGYRVEPLFDPSLAKYDPVIMDSSTGWDMPHIFVKKIHSKLSDLVTSILHKEVKEEPHSTVAKNTKVNQGERIDYVVQENTLTSAGPAAYSSALGAHSGYWTNNDVMLFLVAQLLR